MTATPKDERERAEDEAADWLVLLAEDPDDAALRARFEAWRTAAPLHDEIWARTARAYDRIGQAPPAHRAQWDAYAAGHPPHSLPGRAAGATILPFKRRNRRPQLVTGVIAAAIAACLILLVGPSLLLRFRADRVTGTGETASLALPDGSTVQMGPESALGIDYGDGQRRVRLLKGEAFFDVVHDAAHPFHVVADMATITDLGTAFEVRRVNDGVDVAVQSGQIRVDDTAAAPPVSTDLLAGDWVQFREGALAERGVLRPDEVASWTGGQLVLHERPVAEVIAALRPYYRGMILVRDDAFAERRVSGLYDLRDPTTTLRDLAASHGATVRQISPWVLVVTAQ